MGAIECMSFFRDAFLTRSLSSADSLFVSQYLQLVPPAARPTPAPPSRAKPPPPPIAAAATPSSRFAEAFAAPVSVMPGMGNGNGGLSAILAAKRSAAAENGSSNGSTPNSSRPGSSMGPS